MKYLFLELFEHFVYTVYIPYRPSNIPKFTLGPQQLYAIISHINYYNP